MAEESYDRIAAAVIRQLADDHRLLRSLPPPRTKQRRGYPIIGADAVKPIPLGGGCECCTGCGCYPSDEGDIVVGCGCNVDQMTVIGLSSLFNGDFTLAHYSGCEWRSDSFTLKTCEGTDREVNHGSHYLKLTVGSGEHDSVLETVGALTIQYYSKWYWHPLCSNEFGYKPDCTTLETLGYSPPRNICVKPAVSECEECVVPPVTVPCCPDAQYPGVLYAHMTAPADPPVYPSTCPDFHNVTVKLIYAGEITWNGIGPLKFWTGTITTACGDMEVGFSSNDMTCNNTFSIFNPATGGFCLSTSGGQPPDCPFTQAIFDKDGYMGGNQLIFAGGPCGGCCDFGHPARVVINSTP